MPKKFLVICIVMLASICGSSYAQEVETGLPDRNVYLGFQARDNGIGLSVDRFAKAIKPNMHLIYGASFTTIHHPKEIRLSNANIQNTTPYVFGKQYFTMLSTAGLGLTKIVLARNSNASVAFGCTGFLGFDVAIQRPVYLEIVKISSTDQMAEYHSERYDPRFHISRENIAGYSRKKGWNELRYLGGMHAKISSELYWGGYGNLIKRAQLGVAIDYFPNGLPIMAIVDNPNLYASLFVSLSWGTSKN